MSKDMHWYTQAAQKKVEKSIATAMAHACQDSFATNSNVTYPTLDLDDLKDFLKKNTEKRPTIAILMRPAMERQLLAHAAATGPYEREPSPWLGHLGVFAGLPVYVAQDDDDLRRLAARLGRLAMEAHGRLFVCLEDDDAAGRVIFAEVLCSLYAGKPIEWPKPKWVAFYKEPSRA